MKVAKFTRCVCPSDDNVIQSWFNNIESVCRKSSESSITVNCTSDLTQQEMDDITALAASRFMLVEFST